MALVLALQAKGKSRLTRRLADGTIDAGGQSNRTGVSQFTLVQYNSTGAIDNSLRRSVENINVSNMMKVYHQSFEQPMSYMQSIDTVRFLIENIMPRSTAFCYLPNL